MNVALIEISESHEECIYSQIRFLKDRGASISGFLHPSIISNINYGSQFKRLTALSTDSRNFLQRIFLVFWLAKKLQSFDKVILNTASSSKTIRNLCLVMLFYPKVEFLGILHNRKKLNTSTTQWLISKKVKKYYVLADHLKGKTIPNTQVQPFYPIFFPGKKNDHYTKPEQELWISIPGRVHFERRQYNFLLNKDFNPPKDIKFVILGNINTNDGIHFRNKIIEKGIEQNFIFFDGFIPNEKLYNLITLSDFICPLLIKSDDYLEHKITGSFNLAYGFRKPMINHIYFKQIPDLQENSLFYDDDNFLEIISSLSLSNFQKNIYSNKKWSFEVQKARYLSFFNAE